MDQIVIKHNSPGTSFALRKTHEIAVHELDFRTLIWLENQKEL